MARPRKVDDALVHRMVTLGNLHPNTVAGMLKVHVSTVYNALRRTVGRPSVGPGERRALEVLWKVVNGNEKAFGEAVALLREKGMDTE